ncbi:MAG: DUF5011 domain-containing protein [Clostridium sp.]|uniref:immunoglobulin-like domain-containing protein n=1 Tax=Clostridium sp. TaxID=1506 RepID=UPI002A750D38|nr:immunoglobulin-like domain-containing protein [Clostridium sp.]MDY2632529.1 DUF5011 domain-containing protein [Clostridium sp.]
MKKLVSSTLLFIMLSSNIVHAISNDITLSNTTLDEKIKIIDNNEIIYMSTNQVIDVTNNTEVLDENGDPIRLLGDGVTDETDKIEKLIEYAISQGRELYFPEGIYKITRDIDLSKVRLPNSSSFKISGDKDGLSIFDGTFNTEKMLRLIHSGYSGEIDCVQIENIVFNNMGIEITQRTKKEVIIKNNIFMNGNYTREKNSDGSISKATMEPYIVAKNTKYTVENNIFLRGTNYPGRGIATYRSENTNISNNFFGDLDSIDDAARMLPTEVISRLAIIKNSNLVEGHQGNFFTAINNERYDTNILISNNYFDMVKTRNILSDFPTDVLVSGINVEKEGQRRDHIIYSKCYENLNIVGNYFKGMENGAAGGVKIRNGNNAYVGSNYFDDVPLLTYIYGDLSRNDTLLYDTVIHNNLFHAKTNFGGEGTGILYYQSFKDGETLEFDVKNSDGTVTKDVWKDAYGDVKNFIIYKNSFLSDERDGITISGRANTAYGNNEFLAYGNTYMELSTLVNYNNKGNYELPEASEGLILSKVNAGYNTYKDVKIPLTPAKVDQSYLEEALGEADKFYQDIINNNLVGDLEGQYSEEATNEFKDKLDQTNNLINSGNLTQAEANKNLTEITEALDKLKDSVKPMGEAPVLLKVTDLQINKGDTVDFMQGIYIIDNKDTKEQLDIKIDLGDFNNLNPGTYTIKYTVTDSDGNVITFTRSIEVLGEDEVIPPEEDEVIPPEEDGVIPPEEDTVVPPEEDGAIPPEEDDTTNDNESSEDITNGTTSNGNVSSGNTSSNNVSSDIISNITTLNGNESKGNTSSSIASNTTTSNVDKSKNDISNNNNSDKESLNDNPISETKDENGVSRVFTSRRKRSFSWLFLLPLLLILVLLLLLKRKKEDDDSDNN